MIPTEYKNEKGPVNIYPVQIPLLPVKPEEDDMSIFLQEVEHKKEKDCIHDKAQNHTGGPRQAA